MNRTERTGICALVEIQATKAKSMYPEMYSAVLPESVVHHLSQYCKKVEKNEYEPVQATRIAKLPKPADLI